MEKSQKNRIDAVVETSLNKIGNLIDVNTVIGEPKIVGNSTIIPISTVTMGILSGGGEYGKCSIFKTKENLPFSAGNGSIISVKPTLMHPENRFEYNSIKLDTEHSK